MPHSLSKAIFKATMEGKMTDVTSNPDARTDVWKYIKENQESLQLPTEVIKGQFVESVHRSGFNHYDHVLVPTGRKNVFLVIVVDRVRGAVYGHHLLDLNAEYGLSPDGGLPEV